MKVNNQEVLFDYGSDFACEILNVIQVLGTNQNKSIHRIDGYGWKAYWAGEVLRIDIEKKELADG